MKYLSARQLMEKLGVGRTTVYTLMHMEGFPVVRLGKRLLVSEEALDAWLANGGAAPKDSQGA